MEYADIPKKTAGARAISPMSFVRNMAFRRLAYNVHENGNNNFTVDLGEVVQPMNVTFYGDRLKVTVAKPTNGTVEASIEFCGISWTTPSASIVQSDLP